MQIKRKSKIFGDDVMDKVERALRENDIISQEEFDKLEKIITETENFERFALSLLPRKDSKGNCYLFKKLDDGTYKVDLKY